MNLNKFYIFEFIILLQILKKVKKESKMKKMLSSILVLGTLSISSYAGSCNATGCNDVTIESISVRTSGSILIATDGDESVLNCTSPANRYITLLDGAGKNAIYSMLLTKMTTKAKATLRITPGSSVCSLAFAK